MRKYLLTITAAAFLLFGFTSTSEAATKTGWASSNGHWYFYSQSGSMYKGWLYSGNHWYYLNTDGIMKTGWATINNKWYYFDASGVMKTGWVSLNNKWYYLDANGAMKTGWIYLSNKWYYLNGDGSMRTGWLNQGGKWYFLLSSGAMAANTTVNGYTFNQNGVWISDPQAVSISWSGNKSIVARIDATENGYKGIRDGNHYELLNSKGNVLYTYTASSSIQQSYLHTDGTVYLIDDSSNLVSLDLSGKVKWKKSISQYSLYDTTFYLAQDGSIALRGNLLTNNEWNTIGIDPSNGNTLWSLDKYVIGVGPNGYVLFQEDSETVSCYKDGKLQWIGDIPEGVDEVIEAHFSSQGNVEIVTNRYYTDSAVRLFNSEGKQLLYRQFKEGEQFISAKFNPKGELMIALFEGLEDTHIKAEWYATSGTLITQSTFPVPTSTNEIWRDFYFTQDDQMIANVNNDKDIYFRLSTGSIFKYNVAGKLVAKTDFPTDFMFDPNMQPNDSSFGLVYSSKSISSSYTSTIYLYTYK